MAVLKVALSWKLKLNALLDKTDNMKFCTGIVEQDNQ